MNRQRRPPESLFRLYLLQLDNLVHHCIGHYVKTEKNVVFVVAEECDVFQDEGVVGLGIDHALAASGIEANGFVVGDAVAEGLDLLQFLEDGLLSETRLAGGEYLQERLTTETEGNLGEHVCPEAETDGGDHLIGRVLALSDHRRDVVQRVALMGRVFQHPAALQLVVNPVGIV